MQGINDLIQLVGLGLLLLLPLTNPLTTVILLLALSGDMTDEERNLQSLLACVYVFLIMIISFYAGQWVMKTFGISIPGLRIAGGLIVSFIGFRMLFPLLPISDSSSVQVKSDEMRRHQSHNIAFVPLAMPSTAGPGTIAMIISTAASIPSGTDHSGWALDFAPVITFIGISVILWFCLRSAGYLFHVFGHSGIDAISRVMGFLLVCMGVQFVINGVLEIIKNYGSMII